MIFPWVGAKIRKYRGEIVKREFWQRIKIARISPISLFRLAARARKPTATEPEKRGKRRKNKEEKTATRAQNREKLENGGNRGSAEPRCTAAADSSAGDQKQYATKSATNCPRENAFLFIFFHFLLSFYLFILFNLIKF